MRLQEGLQLRGKPVVVPDCPRNELPQVLFDLGCRVGAEIGVYKGDFTKKLCAAGLKVYAVDPWKAFAGQGRSQKLQERQDFLFGHAQRNLAEFGRQVTFIRKISADALADVRNNSLDFVYVDGNHEFSHAAFDIYEWSKKVKPGGVVSGHDHFNSWVQARNCICHVEAVVNAYTELFGVENWWLFGALDREKWKTKDDKYNSWMWFKP